MKSNDFPARRIERRVRGYALIALSKFLTKVVVPQINEALRNAEHYYWWTEEPHVVTAKKEIKQAAIRLDRVGTRMTKTDKPPKGYRDRVKAAKKGSLRG